MHIIRNINKLFTYTIGYNLLSLCIVDVGRAIHVNNIYIQVCTYQKLSYMIQSRVGDYIRIHWARSHWPMIILPHITQCMAMDIISYSCELWLVTKLSMSYMYDTHKKKFICIWLRVIFQPFNHFITRYAILHDYRQDR